MKTGFLFLLQTIYKLASFVQIPKAIGAFYHIWKWHNFQRVRSEMRCCTTHALYPYKLSQQDHCQHPQNANLDGSTLKGRVQGDENKVSGYGYGLWCGFKWGPQHTTLHLRSRLESQHQSVPGCAEEFDDPLMQSGGRWQTLGMAAGLGDSPQVQSLASEGVLRLCTLLSLSPPPPTWTCWTTSFGHTSRTSTWSPTTPEPAWSLPSTCYVLTFWPGQKCHSRWRTGRKWHIPVAGNRKRLRRRWGVSILLRVSLKVI